MCNFGGRRMSGFEVIDRGFPRVAGSKIIKARSEYDLKAYNLINAAAFNRINTIPCSAARTRLG